MRGFWRTPLLASVLMLSGAGAMAQLASVALPPGLPFPESVAVVPDGTLYISSITNGGVARAMPDEVAAKQWIAPGTFGTRSTFGMLAEAESITLFVGIRSKKRRF